MGTVGSDKGISAVRAPRGSTLTAQGWPQEAALRMLMNNLDPEVAERPEDLVVYGGTGKAARDWPSYHALVRTLTTLRDDETMLVQSGRPVGVFRTHEWAPRVLLANSNLVGDWATWPEFRRLEALGLTMYGQMTAGSWIYIGTQGILQGTYETFAAVGRASGSAARLAGTLTLTAGCGGMGGAQPLAVTMNGGACLVIDVDPARLQRRVQTPLPRRGGRRPRRRGRAGGRGQGGTAGRCSIGVVGNAATIVPELLRRGVPIDIVTDQTSAHDPLSYVPEGRRPGRRARLRGEEAGGVHRPGPRRRWPSTSRRWSASWTPAPRSSTTATRSAARPSWAGTSGRSPSPASCRPTSGRCSARARARSAGRRSPATRPTSPPPTGPSSTCSRTTSRWPGGSGWPASGSPSRACRPASAGSATASATWPALRFNEMVARGELSAPVVIGRDHLDCGSVASPYRETEAMRDGSDAIADWPLLNALVNTASGASWVSIHHGGGVGIGRSIHAGQVTVADGTALAGAEDRTGAHQRPGHGRDPPRRRRLRAGRAGRRRARRAHPDARSMR